MNASQLQRDKHYPNFPEFERYNTPLHLLDCNLILTLQSLRERSQILIWPSPNPEGWARLVGNVKSRHYAVDRLSDAGDVFPKRGRAMELWVIAQQYERIGGLGLYSNTTGPDGYPWVMMHFDLRPSARTFWVRENGRYWYLHSEPREFWRGIDRIINIEGEM